VEFEAEAVNLLISACFCVWSSCTVTLSGGRQPLYTVETLIWLVDRYSV
jgi:hypothetical protein